MDVRTKPRSHFARRNFALRGALARRRFAVWCMTSAALIAGAVSWSPQPAAAATSRAPVATSQAPATPLVIGATGQRHLLALYAAYRHVPVADIARRQRERCSARGCRAAVRTGP